MNFIIIVLIIELKLQMYKIIGNNKKKYRFLCSLFAKLMPMDNKNGNPFPSGVTAGCR